MKTQSINEENPNEKVSWKFSGNFIVKKKLIVEIFTTHYEKSHVESMSEAIKNWHSQKIISHPYPRHNDIFYSFFFGFICMFSENCEFLDVESLSHESEHEKEEISLVNSLTYDYVINYLCVS